VIDLKRTPKKKAKNATVCSYEEPEYGYGTAIRLDDEELSKLGIKDLPDVGYEGIVRAKVRVTSARQSASTTKTERSLELQILAMDLKLEDKDDEDGSSHDEKAKSKIAKKLEAM
jgi:hypothetical protein